jgi:hypothetical protein
MVRTDSRGSTSQRGGKIPFTQNGAVPATLRPESRQDNPAMTAWDTQDQPLSSYTFSHQTPQLQRSMSQRKSELQRVPEHTHVVEDPIDFITRTVGTPIVQISPAMSMPFAAPQHHRLSTGSLNIPTPSTPSDSLTTASTLTSNSMSRSNSLCNEQMLESMQMMKVHSTASYSDFNHVDHTMYDQVAPTFTSSSHTRRSSNEEQSQLLVGAGGASHDSQFSHSLSPDFTSSGSFGAKMEKTQSVESTSSQSSSRNVKRLQAQINIAAARPLMPKGGSDDDAMSRNNSSQSMTRLESKDGSQDKVAISKPAYQRPKHDRVYCKQCDSHSEGFRGEHELRRHMDREHKSLVKKWVCSEPADGLKHPKPVVPLSRCKACGQQKKKYGAYYNAAAHLRRTHFKPKTSKGRKSSKTESEESRAGKGGGDWPPMTELKYWMKEVEEVAPEYSLTTSQQDEADASEDENDVTIDDEIYSQNTMSSIGSTNFDNALFDVSPTYNIYPAPVNSDMYSMPMPLDSQSQCMDQSMYNGANQVNFPNFSPSDFQNDPLAFLDTSLPHSFDDQVVLTGHDFNFSTYQ